MSQTLSRECWLLVANYHRDTNRIMECLLWLNGYDVHSVESIAEAKAQLESKSKSFSLLIARNAMPDGDGPSLIEHAWKRFRLPSIGLSGTVGKEEMAARISTPDALKSVLTIPFTHKSLLDAIAGALGKSNVGPTQVNLSDVAKPPRCPECHGRGQIELLIRRVPCHRCGGVGELRIDIADLPLRHVHVIPATIRFALHRSGLRTLREVKRLNRDEIQSRAGLSDSAMEAIEKVLA